MKLTRNTKLYIANDGKQVSVVYRTLTISEIAVLEKIHNSVYKAETAYDIAYISGNEPNFLAKYQIGQDIIEASVLEINDETLFALTVDDFRDTVKNDLAFNLIPSIITVLPGTTIEYLLNLTYLDLIELGALCEKMSNKKIFNTTTALSKPVDTKKDGKLFFDDNDGRSLQEKMKDLSNF